MFLITGDFICFCKCVMRDLPNGISKLLNLIVYKVYKNLKLYKK